MDLQVVLDLDETLVSAYETSSLPDNLRTQAIEAGLKWFELECISSAKVLITYSKCFLISTLNQSILFVHVQIISLFWHDRDAKGSLKSITLQCLSVQGCMNS